MDLWRKLFGAHRKESISKDLIDLSQSSSKSAKSPSNEISQVSSEIMLLPDGSSSIVNVWAVVDAHTISWLKQKTREEAIVFAIQVCEVIADDIYSAIKEWMDRDKCFPSIVMAEPFSKHNAVKAVIQTCEGGSPEWRRILEKCKDFLCRTGHTELGGQVAIVIGCLQNTSNKSFTEEYRKNVREYYEICYKKEYDDTRNRVLSNVVVRPGENPYTAGQSALIEFRGSALLTNSFFKIISLR